MEEIVKNENYQSNDLNKDIRFLEISNYKKMRDFFDTQSDKKIVIFSYFMFLAFLSLSFLLIVFAFNDIEGSINNKLKMLFDYVASLTIILFSSIVIVGYSFILVLIEIFRLYSPYKMRKEYAKNKERIKVSYSVSDETYNKIANNFNLFKYSEYADNLNEKELLEAEAFYNKNINIFKFKLLFERLFIFSTISFAILSTLIFDLNNDNPFPMISTSFIVFIIPLFAFIKIKK